MADQIAADGKLLALPAITHRVGEQVELVDLAGAAVEPGHAELRLRRGGLRPRDRERHDAARGRAAHQKIPHPVHASTPIASLSPISSRTSVRRPVTAAAAAIAGDTRCVRDPGPWRPMKLRLEVEAQRSPAGILSG